MANENVISWGKTILKCGSMADIKLITLNCVGTGASNPWYLLKCEYQLLLENTEPSLPQMMSKVAKMIYDSISDACLVIFVHNLAIQSQQFDQNPAQT